MHVGGASVLSVENDTMSPTAVPEAFPAAIRK
jgi:hypothetical protein